MKWPMPSEAKFSPAFHDVSPAIVPLHSFCQMRLPIRSRSAAESAIAFTSGTKQMNTSAKITTRASLDAPRFEGSMRLPSVVALKRIVVRLIIPMKKFPIFTAIVTLGTTAFAEDKAASAGTTQLKDQKDKVSYSIGLNIGFSMAKENVDVNADALA